MLLTPIASFSFNRSFSSKSPFRCLSRFVSRFLPRFLPTWYAIAQLLISPIFYYSNIADCRCEFRRKISSRSYIDTVFSINACMRIIPENTKMGGRAQYLRFLLDKEANKQTSFSWTKTLQRFYQNLRNIFKRYT